MAILKLTENLEVIDLDSSSKLPVGHFTKESDTSFKFVRKPFTAAIQDVSAQEQLCWIQRELEG
uniref:Uncharacterized protein n=1 Tax=Vibrio phage P018-4 TaxID=3229728 RepID=A0AB39AJQ7_9CAUD